MKVDPTSCLNWSCSPSTGHAEVKGKQFRCRQYPNMDALILLCDLLFCDFMVVRDEYIYMNLIVVIDDGIQ